MWAAISRIILRYRVIIIILLLALTALMVHFSQSVGLDYNFAKLLPENDQANIDHVSFREDFGQDGSVIVIGTKDSLMFKDTAHFQ